MSPDKQRSAMDGCVICYREVKSNRRRMTLDMSEYEGEYTVRVRLEQILEDSLPDNSPTWMCDLCYKELAQIEQYHELLKRFKFKYQNTRDLIENAERNETLRNTEKTRKTNVLMNSVQNAAAAPNKETEGESNPNMIQLHLPYLSQISDNQEQPEVEVKTEIEEEEEEEENHDTSFSTTESTEESLPVEAPCPTMGYEGALKKPIKCVICGESGDALFMRKHMNEFHCNELHPLSCKTCGKSFRSKKKLLRHSALHNGRRPYKCLLCPKDFNSTEHLRRHLKVHSKSLPFRCCDKDLNTKEDLQNHMMEHRLHRENRYKCSDCEEIYTSKKEYVNHLKTIHCERYEELKTDLEVTCMICNKSFANQSKLTRHMQSHSDIAPFACDLCEKRFKREQTLLEHRRVHSGEKPYQCSMCDKSYLARASLQSHERTHTGEKQCLCPVCGKGFHENSYLTRHMTTHSEEKKYKCPVCGKGFKRADHVSKHMPIHTGIKPFLCNICGSAFARLDKLKQHMHKHNRPDKPKAERKPRVPKAPRPPKIQVPGAEGEKPKKPRIRKPKKPKVDSDATVKAPVVTIKTDNGEAPPANPANPSMDAPACPPPVIVDHPHHNMEAHSSLASALSSAQFITASHIGLMAIGAQYGTYPYGMEEDGENKFMNIPQVDMHHPTEGHFNKHLGHH